MPTIHLVSLGCVKNRVDSEVLLGVAQRHGYRIVDEPNQAEVIVVNTCGFIGEAEKESIDTILDLAGHSEFRGTCKTLIVAGCCATVLERFGVADTRSGSLPRLSDMLKLADVLSGNAERVMVGNPADWIMRASDPRVLTQSRASAWMKLAEGCNRTCAFCVIPQIRGPHQRSRPAHDLMIEAERLIAGGAIELNVVSQDTSRLRERPSARSACSSRRRASSDCGPPRRPVDTALLPLP